MIVEIQKTDPEVMVRERTVFQSFHVHAPAGYGWHGFPGIRQADEADEVWVSVDSLIGWAGDASQEWLDGLSDMVSAAAAHGWTTPDASEIRAHVEWADPCDIGSSHAPVSR